MKISIVFECDNAAFDSDLIGEVERVLARASRRIERAVTRAVDSGQEEWFSEKILDTNGNSIGYVALMPLDEGGIGEPPEAPRETESEDGDG